MSPNVMEVFLNCKDAWSLIRSFTIFIGGCININHILCSLTELPSNQAIVIILA